MQRRAAAGGAELDALLVIGPLDDAIHIDAGGVDQVGVQLADIDEFLHLGHGHRAAGGDHRVKIARRLPIDQVARPVPFPCLDDSDVGANAFFENVFRAVEDPSVFALGEIRAVGRASVKAGNACAAGA